MSELKAFQQRIELNTLYATDASGRGVDQLNPNLEVVGGSVTVYGSQEEPGSPPTGMASQDGVSGLQPFAVMPNYLYIEQDEGTTTSLILSGIQATPVI